MGTEPGPNQLDYESPRPLVAGGKYLIWTWITPPASIVLGLLGIVMAAGRFPRPVFGGCYILSLMCPLIGLVYAIRGRRNGFRGGALTVGLIVNLTILTSYLVFTFWVISIY